MGAFFVLLLTLWWVSCLETASEKTTTINVIEEEPIETSDYYWREYNGVIPSDAIAGGIDKSGNPTYIGQIPYKGPRLLPATIYRGCTTAYSTAYGKGITEDKNIKILCSRNQHRYNWIPIRFEDLHLLASCELVVGGMEKEHTLYIGRVYHERKTRIGKVFDTNAPYDGLTVPYKGREIKYMSFEVLAYNCSVNHFCNIVDVETS